MYLQRATGRQEPQLSLTNCNREVLFCGLVQFYFFIIFMSGGFFFVFKMAPWLRVLALLADLRSDASSPVRQLTELPVTPALADPLPSFSGLPGPLSI